MITADTARANPVVRRRAWRTFIAAARSAAGVSEDAFATAIGISRARLRAYLASPIEGDEDDGKGPAFPLDALPGLLEDDAELGPRGRALYDRILGELARLRGAAVVDLPTAARDTGNDLAQLEELQRATTSIVGRLLAALADLRIDRSEAAPIRPLIGEAIACLLRWDQLLERVEREGVVSVRADRT